MLPEGIIGFLGFPACCWCLHKKAVSRSSLVIRSRTLVTTPVYRVIKHDVTGNGIFTSIHGRPELCCMHSPWSIYPVVLIMLDCLCPGQDRYADEAEISARLGGLY